LDRATAVIFDYRTVHRGTANRTPTDRPLVYCVFGKRGWQDTANFNSADSLFEPPAATATAAVQ
jgi:ectoine hydroxylase-related dioxygenase (phytanoyl-CoA dioxygenase family)